MKKILGGRGSGKTFNLMVYAIENGYVFAVSDEYKKKIMGIKAKGHGFNDLKIMTFEEIKNGAARGRGIVIDEFDYTVANLLEVYTGAKLVGYSMNMGDSIYEEEGKVGG